MRLIIPTNSQLLRERAAERGFRPVKSILFGMLFLAFSAMAGSTNSFEDLIEPAGPVADTTKTVASVVCEGITVVKGQHDVRPIYYDGASEAMACLQLNAIGTYAIHFEHPLGSNQPPVNLMVAPRNDSPPTTNTVRIGERGPSAITNRLGDTLILEWHRIPGRGPSGAGWFFRGITNTKKSQPSAEP
jgi:hypothetical protein